MAGCGKIVLYRNTTIHDGGESVIDIVHLRKYYEEDTVMVTQHASERFRQRGIKMKDIKSGIMNGEIIEQYPDDFQFPSCLILGYTLNKRPIHIAMSDEGTSSRIITAYIPLIEKWQDDYRTRKE